MEYQVEPELNQRLPRSVRPEEPVSAIGCLTLFWIPFVAIGVGTGIFFVNGVMEFLSPPLPIPANGTLYSDLGVLGICFMGFFALFWNGALGFMFFQGAKKGRQDYLLVREGVPVPATILERQIDSNNDSKSSVFRYQFALANNPTHLFQGEQMVPKSNDGGISIGDTITVLYLPERPHQNTLYQFCAFNASGKQNPEYALGRMEETPTPPIDASATRLAAHTIESELQQSLPRHLQPLEQDSLRELVYGGLFFAPFVVIGIGSFLYALALTFFPSGVKRLTFLHDEAIEFFWLWTLVWLWTLFWNGVVSVFLAVLFSRYLYERRLVRCGIAVPGLLTAKTKDTTGDNDLFYLVYRFVPHEALQPQEGKYTVSESEWNAVALGEMLTALYLPRSPHKNLLYRYAIVKAQLRVNSPLQ